MRWTIALMALLMIFAAGCAAEQETTPPAPSDTAPEQDTTAAEDTTADEPDTTEGFDEEPETSDQPAEEDTTADEPEEATSSDEPEEVDTLQARDPDLYDLLEEARAKNYDNFEYVYSGPEYPQDIVEFSLRGSKGKAVPSKPTRFSASEAFDTVYLDLTIGKATGYCESPDCGNKSFKKELDYDYYNILTPADRLRKITKDITRIGSGQVGNRKVIRIIYTSDSGESMQAYIDEFYGVPIKLEKLDSAGKVTQEMVYEDMSIGGVKESDVTPK